MGASDLPHPGIHTVPPVPFSFSLVAITILRPHRHSFLVLGAMVTWLPDSCDGIRHKHPERLASCWVHIPLAQPKPHILTTCPIPPQLQTQAWSPTPKEGHLCLMSIPVRPGIAVLCQEFVYTKKPAAQGRSGPGAQPR